MLSKTLSTCAVAVIVAASALVSTAVFAQFPPPPLKAPAGPSPMAPATLPTFAGPPQPGPVAGLGPRLGPAAGPRADLAARGVGGGPTVANAPRTTAVNIGGAGAYRYGGAHGYESGARAASYAGAYAAGAYAGYAYGGARTSEYSSSDCYYAYRGHRRYLVCD